MNNELKNEPVAWLDPELKEKICPEVGYEATITMRHPKDLGWIPLYLNHSELVKLTDDEIQEAYDLISEKEWSNSEKRIHYVTFIVHILEKKLMDKQIARNGIDRAIELERENRRLTEALLKANSQAEHFEREWYLRGDEIELLQIECSNCAKEWISLSQEEYAYGLQLSSNTSWMQAAKWVEATLKKKNLGLI